MTKCFRQKSLRLQEKGIGLESNSLLNLSLSQSQLFPEPFVYWHAIYVQEKKTFLVPYHLCCDIIGKCIASVLSGMQPPAIIDALSVQKFVGLFCVKTILQTLPLHVEETLETWEPSISLV